MFNKFLHALTNRRGPFIEPIFVGDTSFVPAVVTPEEVKFREALFLHVTETDYYLKVLLSCVEAFPDIKELVDDRVTSYLMVDLAPKGVEINGGDFLSKYNDVGFYADTPPTTLPVALTYRVSYFDTRNVWLHQMETGLKAQALYSLSGTAPNQFMRVEWPENFPFKGSLQLAQEWSSLAMLEIKVEPSAFPFEKLVQRLDVTSLLMTLLMRYRMVDEYTSVPDFNRKTAIAAALLALSNPSVYPQD